MRMLVNGNFPGDGVAALRALGHDVSWVSAIRLHRQRESSGSRSVSLPWKAEQIGPGIWLWSKTIRAV